MTETQSFPEHGKLFLFLFTNIWFLCFVALAWTAFSAWLSVRCRDWFWFARSGAIIAIIGGMLTCRTALRRTAEYHRGIIHMSIFQTLAPEEFVDMERDATATRIGVFFLVSGSLIWAYGDLLGRRNRQPQIKA